MEREKLQFRLETRAQLLKNLAERYPDFRLENAELAGRIQAAGQRLETLRQERLEQHGLSPGKMYVLSFLLNEELMRRDLPSPSEIAQGLGVTPATITGLLDGLERDGYVERQPDPEDRRALAIRLTERGRRFFDTYLPVQSRALSAWLDRLEPQERQTLSDLLARLCPPQAGDAPG